MRRVRRPEHAITVQTMIIDIVGTRNVALELGIVITGANLAGAASDSSSSGRFLRLGSWTAE